MRKTFIDTNSIIIEKTKAWYDSVIRFFRNTRIGLYNLWVWTPIIWHDKWWDYSYLLIILKKKLILDGIQYHDNGHCEDSLQNSDNMFRCAMICKRLIDDDYLDKEIEEHCKKYPVEVLSSSPDEQDMVQIQFIQSDEGRNEAKELFDRKEKMWTIDKQHLFAILNKELTNWSD